MRLWRRDEDLHSVAKVLETSQHLATGALAQGSRVPRQQIVSAACHGSPRSGHDDLGVVNIKQRVLLHTGIACMQMSSLGCKARAMDCILK